MSKPTEQPDTAMREAERLLPQFPDGANSRSDGERFARRRQQQEIAQAIREAEQRGRAAELARIEAIADFLPEISGRGLINAAKEILP